MPRTPDRRDLDPRAPYAESINRALAAPDATCGWSGDPMCFLAWNRLLGAWEVWRSEEEGDRLIVRAPSGERLDIARLLKGLVERDITVRNHQSVQEAVIQANEALDREKTEALQDSTRDALDRTYHAVGREMGIKGGVSLSGAYKLG